MKDKISSAIRALLPKYMFILTNDGRDDAHPYDINCGLCEDFALEVIGLVGGETDDLVMVWIEDLDERYEDYSHCVIQLEEDGQTYWFDSECPNGVIHLEDIPCVQNRKKPRKEVIGQ